MDATLKTNDEEAAGMVTSTPNNKDAQNLVKDFTNNITNNKSSDDHKETNLESSITEQQAASKAEVAETSKSSKKNPLSLRTMANVVLRLQKGLQRAEPKPSQINDVHYWRTVAGAREAESGRYLRIIELQRQRIETLENDLKALVGLARETQQLLAGINVEKGAKPEQK
ncbi:uncharacterized protein LOC115631037 [Scaptodrosophila lebanonensis]|uniref:Uncharacterized protein LOC115631037 n=1 Tax=Drosophila lebanonensis TaxID=7225 RepID=A0A6J2U7J8_DROLE|nr:uncharacterized protein LOC115631037 [Scaptodrosophila lebanonensis]